IHMEGESSSPHTATNVERYLDVVRQAIRQRNQQAVADLRLKVGAGDSREIELGYLLMLVVDVWRHPGRLPVLAEFAASPRAPAPAAAGLIELLQEYAFAGRDRQYVGGNCHRPPAADPGADRPSR